MRAGLTFSLCLLLVNAAAYKATAYDNAIAYAEFKFSERHEPRCDVSGCHTYTSITVDLSALSNAERLNVCNQIRRSNTVRVTHLSISKVDGTSSFGPTSCGFVSDQKPVLIFGFYGKIK